MLVASLVQGTWGDTSKNKNKNKIHEQKYKVTLVCTN